MKSLKQYLPESFLVELSEGPTDSVSPLGGGSDTSATPNANELARTQNELQLDDKVKIVGNVDKRGEKGRITNFDSNKSFVVVQLRNGKDYSFHVSDVEYVDPETDHDEDDEEDEEHERELNNWRELAGISNGQR
jgi:hypothetical protein